MKESIFKMDSIPKSIAYAAIPTMIGQLGTIIYNMADTYFIGQINDVQQVSAISLTMPIFLLLMSVGALFGIGSSILISKNIGMNNKEEVKKISTFCWYASLSMGLVISVLGILTIDSIVAWLGATGDTYVYAKEYLMVILFGSISIVISNSFSFVLRSVGEASKAMMGLVIGTILNIVLDPIFILVFDMGVKGAAIATIIANVVNAAMYFIYIKRNSILSIRWLDLSWSIDLQKQIVLAGIPGALITILLSVSNIILNIFCASYGDEVVAAMGIVGKINLFPIQLAVGLGQGVQPLIGYCIGSKQFDRLKKLLKYSSLISVIMGIFFFVLFFLFKSQLMYLFLRNEIVVDFGSRFLIIVSISTPMLGLIFIYSNLFQSLEMFKESLLLSFARQGLFYIPLILLGNSILKVNGVVLAQPLSDIFCVVLIYFMYIKMRKNKFNNY